MKKATIIVMIITVISKIVGFGREIALSYVYGASSITDAYLISHTIPLTIFSFISAGIGTGYIPLYSRIRKENGQASANQFTSNLCNVLLVICTIIVVVVLLFTEPIVKVFASGFSGETLTLAVKFTRITVFGIYVTGLLGIFAAYLRIYENYLIPALIGFPMNFLIIISLFVSAKTNVFILAIGTLLATLAQLVMLIPFVYKLGFKHNFNLNMKDEHLRAMLIIALPVIIGTSVNEINVLVDRILASGIAVGGISALNYARRLNEFVQGLFVTSITTVIFPIISKLAAENNVKRLKHTISEAIAMVCLLVIPITIGAMVFSRQIVSLLFGRGAFTGEAISMTANALFYYSIGMIAFGLRDILARAFYAQQDTKTPMINSAISVVINIVLNIILAKYLGIGGLALATSISSIVAMVLMFVTLRKKIGPFGLKMLARSFMKIIVASVIMGFLAYISFSYAKLLLNENISLIIAIGFGALVYGILILLMRIPEVDSILNILKKKIKGRLQKPGLSG